MRYIIVGGGVAGTTAAQTIRRLDPNGEVHCYAAEPYPYYFRPRLWELIAGSANEEDVFFRPAEWYAKQGIELHLATPVSRLIPDAHEIEFEDGQREKYDRLLLATGGRPFRPPFTGNDLPRVVTLRTLDDAHNLIEISKKAERFVVIGGGLLGLETAYSLLQRGMQVNVAEVFPRLLPRQLDEPGAQLLQNLLEKMGFSFTLGAETQEITLSGDILGVQMGDGRLLEGEAVLISAGIRSNVDLARSAGIKVNRGTVIDQFLQTSAPDVYAAGDAAEFEGTVYGIIPAASEQGNAAAKNMVNPGSVVYDGTLANTRLKVVGVQLASLGEAVAEDPQCVILRKLDEKTGNYLRLTLRDQRLTGAILMGDTSAFVYIRRLIDSKKDLSGVADQLLQDDFDLKGFALG
jgi:nitrite reductase (NADH) large subunit